MHVTHFDALTRSLVAPAPRRVALRLLTAGLLGTLLPARIARAAQHSDRDGDGLFDEDEEQVYSTNPDLFDTDGDGTGDGEEIYNRDNGLGGPSDPLTPDGGGPVPVNCAAGLTECGGICVDLANDRNHCGRCGGACAEGVNCWDSNCGGRGVPPPPPVTCAPGLHNCGTYCANVAQDPANCGICGSDCGNRDRYFCYQGACVEYCGVGTRRCTGEYWCRPNDQACPA